MKAIWFLVIIGSILGGYTFFETMGQREISAPQQAAGMAIAIAAAVIPYCFLRACQFIVDDPRVQELRAIRELLETHTRLLASTANSAAVTTEPPDRADGTTA